MADFGQILQAFNQGGGQPGGVQPMQSPIGMPPVGSADKDAKSQKMSMLLYALGGALKGQDPLQQGMAVRQMQQQQQRIKEQKENQARIMESLQKSGWNEEEIALYGAGLDAKDILQIRKERGLGQSGQQMIQDVEANVKKTEQETGVVDSFANLSEAFGPLDALQEGISKGTRILGFDIESETASAVRNKNSLNTEILANLAADFTGRPNMLIYENLKGNLPMTSATSESAARDQYENVRDQVDARINNLKQGLTSKIISDSDKEEYRNELNKSMLLSRKLDAAILSLSGKKEETLKPNSFVSEGKWSNLYTNG